MPQVSLEDWKRFIDRNPEAHLLQMAEWGELKASFGWQVVRVISDEAGAQVLFRRLPLGFTVAYLPKPGLGLLSSPRTDLLWQELEATCAARKAILLKIEPDAWSSDQSPRDLAGLLRRPNKTALRVSRHNIQPPRTVVVSLQGSEDELLERMKQKCRYNIRLAEKKGVTVRAWQDLKGYHAMALATGGRDGFAVHSEEYYKRAYELFHDSGHCELLVAEYEGSPLAALMVFRQGRRAWYLYGASNDLERNRMPTYLLQWEAMCWAKAKGCEEYDLWGVPDEQEPVLEANFQTRQDGLWGVYRFKRGFGGEVRRSVQAVDLVLNPLLYQAYTWRMAGREAA
jgi:peptidoglycan pentaglycine glycine transferase (the first glycine)